MAHLVKNPPANAGDSGLIPGLGRFPRYGNGNTIQYSCRENPIDRRAWQATVHGVTRVRHDLVVEHHGRAHHAHHGRTIRNSSLSLAFSLSLSLSLSLSHVQTHTQNYLMLLSGRIKHAIYFLFLIFTTVKLLVHTFC